MKIAIQNLQKKIPINPKKIKALVLKVLQIEKIKKTGQINLFFVSDNKIRKLNFRYRGEDYATDVLTFDISTLDQRQMLADIFISVDRTIANARTFESYPLYEIYLYIIHAILHLIGYDDTTIRKRQIIEKKQRGIICRLLKPKP